MFGHGRPFLVALMTPAAPDRHAELARAVDEANRRLPEYARVRRYHVLQHTLGHQRAELTADGRPRRAAIENRFHLLLESLYQEDTHAVL